MDAVVGIAASTIEGTGSTGRSVVVRLVDCGSEVSIMESILDTDKLGFAAEVTTACCVEKRPCSVDAELLHDIHMGKKKKLMPSLVLTCFFIEILLRMQGQIR